MNLEINISSYSNFVFSKILHPLCPQYIGDILDLSLKYTEGQLAALRIGNTSLVFSALLWVLPVTRRPPLTALATHMLISMKFH